MIEIYLLLQLAITIEPISAISALTSLVKLVGTGAFAYYWIRKNSKEA